MFSKLIKLISPISPIGPIRVRIAPSPTGYLHIGTARTALFNWLFAKKHGGKFILRIEDTDLERSDKKYEKDIIDGLRWLGLDWDEGPHRQSERLAIYEKYLQNLLSENQAYYCACTKETLEKERQLQIKKGEAPKYSGRCRNFKIAPEQGEIIRFKIPPAEKIQFLDLIRGPIIFDSSLIGDLAIAKNLQTPLYNFAVVIDDYEMKISHVIRGEDHIANTPKQILLQRALNFPEPKYAHLPLILDPDRSKMSKRYSATSIQEYKERGYLPETLVNFIALLGWHPADDQEKMAASEIIRKFSLERIQKAGAVFDIQKLNWLNSQYLKEKSESELWQKIKELYDKKISIQNEAALKLLKIGKLRMSKLEDFLSLQESLTLPDYDSNLLSWKNTHKETTKEALRLAQEVTRTILVHEFNQKNLENQLMPLADNQGRGEFLWPLRVALSGKDKSPGPFELMEVLGKEESLRRINIAIEKL
ncbi:MAG: glutamate--tRNA ligase [Candidatus Harrisonbacteria bacterium]|nr:glutamate--tRNA ligase [Candidatus Harrisonbacteria bacterium]